MTVGQLREILDQYSDGTDVLVSYHGVGNPIRFVHGALPGTYTRFSDGKIEVGVRESDLTPRIRKMGYTEKDVRETDGLIILS